VTEYKRRTHGEQHYTVSKGVQDVQKKLARGIDTRLSATVSAVETQPSGVRISLRQTEDALGLTVGEELFDRVVLAVSPDVVGRVFMPLQYEMAQIPIASVESIIQTDKNRVGERFGLLDGQNIAARNSLLHHNAAHTIHLRTSMEGPHRTESIHVQPSGALVTTCPFSHIDPVQVIKSFKFTRVLRTPESRRIINNIFGDCDPVGGIGGEKRSSGWRNGDGRVWLVGGWCWDGMVLLEGCVSSAMRVAEAFNVQVPWRAPSS
jgi:Flavin containing amine oxidoreductase